MTLSDFGFIRITVVTMLSIHDRQMKMQAEILGLYTTVSFQAKKKMIVACIRVVVVEVLIIQLR